MVYSFDSRVAQKYGVDGAIVIHNLYWWICKNEANGRHHRDGKTWTYNSVKAFAQLFPFWTQRQIERIIRKLKDEGAVYAANYNQNAWDRTQWYALSDEVKSIYTNGEMHVTESVNGFTRTVEPIPDSKPDINADINTDGEAPARSALKEELLGMYGPEVAGIYIAKAEVRGYTGEEAVRRAYVWIKEDDACGKLDQYYQIEG